MQSRRFGRLGIVSALTMGGGGIGQVWGATSREESVATLRAAVDAGITLIDVAASYGQDGEAERVVGAAFEGRLPDGVRVVTKVALRAPWSTFATQPITAELIDQALRDSVERLQLDYVDLYLLHDMIIPESGAEDEPGTPLEVYRKTVRPVFEDLVRAGRIGAWGISARGMSSALNAALAEDPPPAAAQVVSSALEFDASLAAAAEARDVAVMGIQPVHSGALADGFDREVEPGDGGVVRARSPAPGNRRRTRRTDRDRRAAVCIGTTPPEHGGDRSQEPPRAGGRLARRSSRPAARRSGEADREGASVGRPPDTVPRISRV